MNIEIVVMATQQRPPFCIVELNMSPSIYIVDVMYPALLPNFNQN